MKLFILGLLLISTKLMALQSNDGVVLAYDDWCPYTCGTENKAGPGYMVELLQLIFQGKGEKVQFKDMPWNRAKAELKAGKILGVIGELKSGEPQLFFHKSELGLDSDCYFTSADDPWVFKNSDSLKGRKIGSVQDYSYGDVFTKFAKANPGSIVTSFGSDSSKSNIQRLIYKRIDTIIENPNVVANFLRINFPNEKIVNKGCSRSEALFVAFYPKANRNEEFAKMIDDGIYQLRKNGELKKLLNKYNLTDWK